jgi:hypothetical protein
MPSLHAEIPGRLEGCAVGCVLIGVVPGGPEWRRELTGMHALLAGDIVGTELA